MEEETELYLPNDDCSAGGTCPGEGVIVLQQAGNRALDSMFIGSEADDECQLDLANIDNHLSSDELFPVIYDGALITRTGLIDCFARKYPERMDLLNRLGEKEGFEIVFTENAFSVMGQLRERAAATRSETYQRRNGSPVSLIPNPGALEADDRLARLRAEISRLATWQFQGKTLYISDIIDKNVNQNNLFEDYADHVNFLPTNEEGADWLYAVMGDWMLRSGIPGASDSELFVDSFNSNMIWGGVNVVFGAAEVAGGVALMMGSTILTLPSGGTSTAGIVAGGAMTLAGFDAFTSGLDMWRTPNEASHRMGWIGDSSFAMLGAFGVVEEDNHLGYSRGWAFAMLGASLAGGGILGFAKNTAQVTRIGRTATHLDFNVPMPARGLTSATPAIMGVKSAPFGQLIASLAPLPSGRIAMNIDDVGHVVVQEWDSLVRIRAALNFSKLEDVQERVSPLLRAERRFASRPNGVNNLAETQELFDFVARHSGFRTRDLRQMISQVTFGGRTSGFNDARVIRIKTRIGYSRVYDTGQYNEMIARNEVFHEIYHAHRYQQWIKTGRGSADDYWAKYRLGSPAYFREEIRVETAAREWTEQMVRPRIVAAERLQNQDEVTRLRQMYDDFIQDSDDYLQDQIRNLGQ